jgi:hypothetical protein
VSLLNVISHFATGVYDLTRTTASAYDANGKLVASNSVVTQVEAGVQPTNGRDLKVLLEAGITSESRAVWTAEPLLSRRPGQEPDVLTIEGDAWVCHQSQTWTKRGETIYRTLVARRSMQ